MGTAIIFDRYLYIIAIKLVDKHCCSSLVLVLVLIHTQEGSLGA